MKSCFLVMMARFRCKGGERHCRSFGRLRPADDKVNHVKNCIKDGRGAVSIGGALADVKRNKSLASIHLRSNECN